MRSLMTICALVVLVGTSPSAHARDTIVVMTQNQYIGADINPIIMAPPELFLQRAIEAVQQVAANNFPERAEAFASQIAAWHPDVVALQEVYDFGCVVGSDPNGQPIIVNGGVPFRNHLNDTLNALDALGETYIEAATVHNIDLLLPLPAPSPVPPCVAIRVLDRGIILLRGDHAQGKKKPTPISFCEGPAQSDADPAQSQDGCNYPVLDSLVTSMLGPIKRGFVGIDATIRGKQYRFVTTQLEQQGLPSPAAVPAQDAQARDLIELLHRPPHKNGHPVIVLGDINSSPTDSSLFSPYHQFTTSTAPRFTPFLDTWLLRPENSPGFTCCQDADLRNSQSALDDRIDVILSSKNPRSVKATLVGNHIADKTYPSGLWPSDHAGVVAELTFD